MCHPHDEVFEPQKDLPFDPPLARGKLSRSGSAFTDGTGSLRSRLMGGSEIGDPIPIVVSISYGPGLNVSHQLQGTICALKRVGSAERTLMVSLRPDPYLISMMEEAVLRPAPPGGLAVTDFDLLIPIEAVSGTSPNT